MPTRDTITIGASAGGLRPLMDILAGLPPGLSASVFVVLHLAPRAESQLAAVLGRVSPLPVKWAEDRDAVEPGWVYVAPPDRHLVLNPGEMRIVMGARESGSRPSIDILFRSAAVAYRSRVVGVILSGTLDDGSRGLRAIKRCGGIAVVLDPELAESPEMPRNAAREVPPDHSLGPHQIAPLLRELAGQAVTAEVSVPEDIALENRAAQYALEGNWKADLGAESGLSCPECGGRLRQFADAPHAVYRCHVGHAYSTGLLLARQNDQLEQAIWIALRVLDDRQRVLQRLADDYQQRQRTQMAEAMADRASELRRQTEILRHALAEICQPDPDDDSPELGTAGA